MSSLYLNHRRISKPANSASKKTIVKTINDDTLNLQSRTITEQRLYSLELCMWLAPTALATCVCCSHHVQMDPQFIKS